SRENATWRVSGIAGQTMSTVLRGTHMRGHGATLAFSYVSPPPPQASYPQCALTQSRRWREVPHPGSHRAGGGDEPLCLRGEQSCGLDRPVWVVSAMRGCEVLDREGAVGL